MQDATIIALPKIESNNRFDFGDNCSSNVASANCIRNCVEEAVDDSRNMEVTVQLVRKHITALSFDSKNSCFSTFLLQFLKHAKNCIADFDVDDGL